MYPQRPAANDARSLSDIGALEDVLVTDMAYSLPVPCRTLSSKPPPLKITELLSAHTLNPLPPPQCFVPFFYIGNNVDVQEGEDGTNKPSQDCHKA